MVFGKDLSLFERSGVLYGGIHNHPGGAYFSGDGVGFFNVGGVSMHAEDSSEGRHVGWKGDLPNAYFDDLRSTVVREGSGQIVRFDPSVFRNLWQRSQGGDAVWLRSGVICIDQCGGGE